MEDLPARGPAAASTAVADGDPRTIGGDVWRVAVVVVLGMLMSALDTTIVNIALVSLSKDLHTTLDTVQWVVTAYLLSLAAVIPVTGWAARRFGAKRLFILSIVLFTAGSALCGLASSVSELIIFRVIQGIGGGLIMPIGTIILVKKSGPIRLPRVMSAVGVPIVLAPVIGPTIGGLLLDNAGWRWIFYVNVPIGVAAVVAAVRLLPKDRPEDAGRLDVPGLGLVAAGLVGVTYGLAGIGTTSFVSDKVLLPLAVGTVLVAGFVLRALRMTRPLLDVRLYANRAFSAASFTTFCIGAAMFGGMILMPLYFQTVRGESAVMTGLLLAPQGIGSAVAIWVGGRATERFGGGVTALMGGLISIAATIPFVAIGAGTSFAFLCVAGAVRGFGLGLSVMPSMTSAFRVLRPDQVNDATPQLNVLQRVGGSIGTAIVTVVLENHLARAGGSVSARAAAFGTTFWWVLVVATLATLPTLLLIRMERRASATAPTTATAAAAAGGPRAPGLAVVEATEALIEAP
ncbi:MAG TPA: DHA2 family efflux MFS transporter permease subunit [Acidimicrobiales bacterium]|nr:DHA2 family efflux MFS transporter permease subunit [Acidimicrobiales bacterium]